MNVKNSYGKEVDFGNAFHYMDDKLRDELHNKLAPCSEQKFFNTYKLAHENKFGKTWIADEENPAW